MSKRASSSPAVQPKKLDQGQEPEGGGGDADYRRDGLSQSAKSRVCLPLEQQFSRSSCFK
jgi:hypothetical protein